MGEQEDDFGAFRSLLHGERRLERFVELCRLAASIEERAPGLFASQMLEYAVEGLKDWPLRATTLGVEYWQVQDLEAVSWAPMVRGLRMLDSTPDTTAQMHAMPWREHLDVEGFLSQPVMLGLCEQGLFDGLSSVAFKAQEWTLGPLLELLEGRDAARGIDAWCLRAHTAGPWLVETFCVSPWAGRVRSLELWSSSNDWRGVIEALVTHAPKFERLERLVFRGGHLDSDDAIRLLDATFPRELEHVGLGLQPLDSSAIGAWLDAGRIGSWVDREGEATLDTSGFRFDQDTFRRCVDAGLFDGLDVWTASGAGGLIPSWAPLRERPNALKGLSRLSMEGVRVEDGAQAVLFDIFPRMELEHLGWEPEGDDVFVETLRTPGLDGLVSRAPSRLLNLNWMTTRIEYGERALAALLDWEWPPALREFRARFNVARESPERARALA